MKEAHERFGEIKEGYRFDRHWAYEHWPNPAIIDNSKRGFNYDNDWDQLSFNGSVLYEKGKWATKLKQMVRVKLIHETLSNNPTYQFKLTNWNETNKAKESGQFLASQLEKYLNGEIE